MYKLINNYNLYMAGSNVSKQITFGNGTETPQTANPKVPIYGTDWQGLLEYHLGENVDDDVESISDSGYDEYEHEKAITGIITNKVCVLMLFSREQQILFGAIKPSLSFKYLDENQDIFSNEEMAGVSEESKVIGISLKLNFVLDVTGELANKIKQNIKETVNYWYKNKEHDVILHMKENENFLSSDNENSNTDLSLIRKIATYEASELENGSGDVEIFFNDLPGKKEMIEVLEKTVKVIYNVPELSESANNQNVRIIATRILNDINKDAQEDRLLIPLEEKPVKLKDILPKILHTAQAESVLYDTQAESDLEDNWAYLAELTAERKTNIMNLSEEEIGLGHSLLTNQEPNEPNKRKNDDELDEPEVKRPKREDVNRI